MAQEHLPTRDEGLSMGSKKVAGNSGSRAVSEFNF